MLTKDIAYKLVNDIIQDVIATQSNITNMELNLTPIPAQIWTRGDGVKYKEFGEIDLTQISTTRHTNVPISDIINIIWRRLLNKTKSKPFELAGPFGSDPFKPAVIYKNIILIKHDRTIQFGSKNRIQSTVWRTRPTKETDPLIHDAHKYANEILDDVIFQDLNMLTLHTLISNAYSKGAINA